MPIDITIAGTVFAYPAPGDEPGWGEDASGAMEAVAAVLEDLQGVNDIPETIVSVANNSSLTDIPGFLFNPAVVRSATVNYSIYRNTDSTELAEKGRIELVYKNGGVVGEKWTLARVMFADDSGVVITMTDAGQAQYTSTNVSGTGYTGTIVFEGVSILQ